MSLTETAHEGQKAATPSEQTGQQPLEERNLRVELEIERGGHCVMDDVDGDIVDVEVRFDQGQCRADLGVKERNDSGSQTGQRQFTSNICAHCPRDVFAAYGCIPRYLEVSTGSFIVETYLPDTETVSQLVGDIRDRCERVTLRSITSTEHQTYADSCTVDLSALTPKQREAVHYAREFGYYDPEVSVDLETIAETLDISKSALSQRLNRAQANVFRQLPTQCDCW